jgi:hypothetical protein
MYVRYLRNSVAETVANFKFIKHLSFATLGSDLDFGSISRVLFLNKFEKTINMMQV